MVQSSHFFFLIIDTNLQSYFCWTVFSISANTSYSSLLATSSYYHLELSLGQAILILSFLSCATSSSIISPAPSTLDFPKLRHRQDKTAETGSPACPSSPTFLNLLILLLVPLLVSLFLLSSCAPRANPLGFDTYTTRQRNLRVHDRLRCDKLASPPHSTIRHF